MQINFWDDESTTGETIRVDSIKSSQIENIFKPTLHSPPEVKIRQIMIHESPLFLKCGHKLQSICMIHVYWIGSSRNDNILNPPYIVQGHYIF